MAAHCAHRLHVRNKNDAASYERHSQARRAAARADCYFGPVTCLYCSTPIEGIGKCTGCGKAHGANVVTRRSELGDLMNIFDQHRAAGNDGEVFISLARVEEEGEHKGKMLYSIVRVHDGKVIDDGPFCALR